MFTNLRSAFRQFRKSPGFTLMAVLTLAVGIGSCVTIFSIINSIVFQALPYPHAERLLMMHETQPPDATPALVTPATYLAWQHRAASFEAIAAWAYRSYTVTGQGEPFRVYAQIPTVNFFSTLGVNPLLGRTFLPQDSDPDKPGVVMLSHRVWKTRFDGRADIIGATITLDDKPFTIIGVMPENYHFDFRVDVFTPLFFSDASQRDYERYLPVMGRLKSTATFEQAKNEMDEIALRLAKEFPPYYKGLGAKIISLREAYIGGYKAISFLLLGAVGCVLLIGCANIANLLLARASSRQREMGIRVALGASRGRLIRQLLGEHFALGALGGALGLIAGKWSLDLITPMISPSLPRASEITMDGSVLIFFAALTLLSSLLFGFVPALKASQVDLNSILKISGHPIVAVTQSTQRLHSLLVIIEIALAVVLLAGAGLFYRSLLKARSNELGFDPAYTYSNVLLLPEAKYASAAEQVQAVNQMAKNLTQVPGVTSIAFTNHTSPTTGAPAGFFSIGNRAATDSGQRPYSYYYAVTPNYFKTLSVPLVRGRFFTEQDNADAPAVALINEELARKYFPASDPIGQEISMISGSTLVAHKIIGIVGNVRQDAPLGDIASQIYEPYAQAPRAATTLFIRTDGPPPDLSALATAVHIVDPGIPFEAIYPMTGGLDRNLRPLFIVLIPFAVFSGIALFLATLGVYGVMTYNVARRTGEIGIRMALGAQNTTILRFILFQSFRTIAIGLLAGLVCTFVLIRLLGSQLWLYETSAYDPVTYVSIITLLALATVLASWVPAYRASKIDLLTALQSS